VVKRFAVLLLLTVSLATGFAQEQSAGVVVRNLSVQEGDSGVGSLLKSRLESRLGDRGFTIVEIDPDAVDGAVRIDAFEPRVSRAIGVDASGDAELVVAAFYRIEDDSIVIQFALLDPLVDVVLGGVLTRVRTGLTISTSIDEAIDELEPALDRYEDDSYRQDPPAGKVERVVVSGPQEGVSVQFANIEVGSVRSGQLIVPYSPFPVGTSVPVTLSKPGYHDIEFEVLLDSVRNTTQLPELHPASRFGFGLEYTLGYGLGFGAAIRTYIVADQTFVGLDHYQSIEEPSLPGSRTTRHFDFALNLGQYLVFPYRSAVRFGVAGGVGLVVTDLDSAAETAPESYLSDDALYTDFYVAGEPFVELNLGAFKVNVRMKLHYALGIGNNLLGARWIALPSVAGIPIPAISLGVLRTW
jgi:hypothetical protein